MDPGNEKPPMPGEARGGNEVFEDTPKISEPAIRRKLSNRRLERMLAGWQTLLDWFPTWRRRP